MEKLTYLTQSDHAPKASAAATRVRELLPSGADLLGAEAIEFKPGAVVLLVVTFPEHADRAFVEHLSKTVSEACDMLARDGARACGVTLPEGTALRAFEVPDATR